MNQQPKIETISDLLSKANLNTKLVNLLSIYRIVTSPILIVLVWANQLEWFRWLLLVSFSTDILDGFLARRYKVVTVLGAKLDSVGDSLTLVSALAGLFIFEFDFLKDHALIFIILICLYIFQLFFSLIRYRKVSSFHTYSAKVSALVMGVFLLSLFFFDEPLLWLFYMAVCATVVEMVEEITLVALLPVWESDLKGLYWLLKERQSKNQ